MGFAQVLTAFGDAGMPNPASVACAKKGGQFVIYRASEGETGVCRFDRALVQALGFKTGS
jgi:putative hemolysin